mgnify:FL=1
MENKKRILAVIPARGGSKSVLNKNIKELSGKPLICYTIELSKKIKAFDKVVVSTDSEDIAKISRASGVDVVARPEKLSTDISRTEDALLNVLKYYDSIGEKFDIVATLEPTSPLRTKETVINCVNYYMQSPCDSLITVVEDRGYLWMNTDANNFSPLFENQSRRRQDRKPLYKEAGVIYITNVTGLIKNKSIIGGVLCHYVVDERESLDINSHTDFLIAESIFMNSLRGRPE